MEGERMRMMEGAGEPDWRGWEDRRVSVCESVWSPLTSVEWPLWWGPRHTPSFSGAIWLVKWTSNRRGWSNACSHIHTAHTQTYTHTVVVQRAFLLVFISVSPSLLCPCSNNWGQTGTNEAPRETQCGLVVCLTKTNKKETSSWPTVFIFCEVLLF